MPPKFASLEPLWAPFRLGQCLIASFLLFGAVSLGWAEEDDAVSPPPPLTSAQVLERRSALDAELASAKPKAEGLAATDAEVQELALLERLDLVYEQELAAIAERAQRESALAAAETELQDLSNLGEGPFPLGQLDDALEERVSYEQRLDDALAGVEAAADALDEARKNLELRERARREARDVVENASDSLGTVAPADELRVRKLGSRVAAEVIVLRTLEWENARLNRRVHETGARLRDLRVAKLAANSVLTAEELQQILSGIEAEESALRRDLVTAKKQVAAAEREWASAQRRVEKTEAGDTVALAEAGARRLALQTRQLAVTTLVQRIQRLGEAREIWQRRLVLAGGTTPRDVVSGWKTELARAQADNERQQRLEKSRIAELNAERRRLEVRPSDEQPLLARWQAFSVETATEKMHLHERALASLEEAGRLQKRFAEELTSSSLAVSVADHVWEAWSTVGETWRYEMFAIDDRPITVGRFAVGLILLVAGLLFSGYLSRLFGKRLLPKLGLEPGAAAAFESLLYYVFVVVLVLLALRTINVPLTAFTLLGGAAAIGIGFGSQNVVNNFISGLILLAERPIRVGDMVEIDGTYGTVEGIGARSTRVHSFTGIHIIVPNSAFLEKNVVNWTLSDDRVRTFVSVGVTYGSPVADVLRLIARAVDERPTVLRKPDPIVLFADFGNDALIFEVHFWIRMRTLMDRRRVESDVRRAIDELFRESNIVIAFPQRDVHLDTVRPLDVRMVASSEVEAEAAEGGGASG